ncbi:hypothetical protein [Nocardia tengchongensis]|uniref:hypothetical protein n=1 Tax=Nocardia tengchongensis TaxID=2055889 RepID=UPI0036771F04
MGTRFGVLSRLTGFLAALAIVFGVAWVIGDRVAPAHPGPPSPTTTARHSHAH